MDSIYQQNRFQQLLQKKWVLVLIVVLILISLLLLILPTASRQDSKPISQALPSPTRIPTQSPQQIPQSRTETGTDQTINQPRATPNPTIVEEQRKADEAVGNREIEIRTNYPWFIKLPARGEKYFVYFETNKKVFVGLLYPTSGDNVAQMKADIMTQLKDVFGIPVKNYTFEWIVSN